MNQLRHLVIRTDEPEKLSAFYIEAFSLPVFAAEPAARLALSTRGITLLRQLAVCALLILSFHAVRTTPAATAGEKPSWQAE